MRLFFFFFLLSGSLVVNAQYGEDEWEERDKWMKVSGLFEISGIKSGDIVADIGCHEGYLTMHLSRKVGKEGKVYAVDVRQDRLDKLKEHLQARKLKNVKAVLGDYDDPKLPKGKLDVAFIVDTYHEMDDYMIILSHIKKALKSNGRLLILEEIKDTDMNKTRAEQESAHSLSTNYVIEELKEAGFEIIKKVEHFGNWKNDSDRKMWVLIAKLKT